MLPSDDELPSVDGTVLDPVPEGISEADGVVAASGVSSEGSAGDPVGEPTGEVPVVVGPFPALHWLIGGVCTLQAPGSERARV